MNRQQKVSMILRKITTHFGCGSVELMVSNKTRQQPFAKARKVAVVLLTELLGLSARNVAKVLGFTAHPGIFAILRKYKQGDWPPEDIRACAVIREQLSYIGEPIRTGQAKKWVRLFDHGFSVVVRS